MSIDDYSWGDGITTHNASFDIDLGASTPWIELGYLGGRFAVTEFEQIDETHFRLVYDFSRGGFLVVLNIEMLAPNMAHIVQEPSNLDLGGIFGPDRIHYRIDGPNIENPPLRFDPPADQGT